MHEKGTNMWNICHVAAHVFDNEFIPKTTATSHANPWNYAVITL